MASEAESQVLQSIESLIQTMRALTDAINIMAQSNAMIAEALLAGPIEPEPEEDPKGFYMDGTPIQ